MPWPTTSLLEDGATRRTKLVRRGGVALIAALLALGACSGGGDEKSASTSSSPRATTPAAEVELNPAVPTIELPRYQPDAAVRLTMSATQPLFLYNVYVNDGPELVDEVVARWPEDLLGYLGFQVVFPAHDKTPEAERAAALDRFLVRTDAARIPALVQTAVFTGATGPTPDELDAAFAKHPSLVGVSVAELSVDVTTVITGLTDSLKDLVAENIETAVRNRGLFLWADMGYLTPQVFVNVGADARLYKLMSEHPDNIIIQVKQNGAGSRFTSMSAAFGFFASGVASNWGINSEDWIWYEASLERLYGPQVPGGMTAAGMVRSEYINRARRTYPEALFGSEMLIAASEGATVYSIEHPHRGTVDPTINGDSPAGPEVVFPLFRRLIAGRLIPDRATVLERLRVAFQPSDAAPAAFASDLAFSGLYGPEGCTDSDRQSCAQRQWLPSTGRYGIIPTIPALTPADVAARFTTVMPPPGGTDEQRQAELNPLFPEPTTTGTSWIAPGGPAGTWFVANPHENQDVTSDVTIPLSGGSELHAVIGPQSFATVDTRNGVSILVDNFRTDSDRLWDQAPSEDELEKIGLDQVGAAAPAETVVDYTVGSGAKRPRLQHTGGELREEWDAASGRLTVTITHRGPVVVRFA